MTMAEISQAESNGVLRQAHTLLKTEGGCMAMLRMPGLAASGDDAEQLGLATPSFQDFPLGPVAFRKANANDRLMVPAATVLQLVQTFAYDSADVLFEMAAGVLIGDVLYGIAKVVVGEATGEPYCYRLTLQAPAR